MKKGITLLILCFIVTVLTACGAGTNAPESGGATSEAVFTQSPSGVVGSSRATSKTTSVESTSENNLQAASENNGVHTIDEAIKHCLNKEIADMFLKGDYYASTYRVLETEEINDSITVYLHYMGEWVDAKGSSISGGAGLISMTFKKTDEAYKLESHLYFIKPDDYETPQSVKDALSSPFYLDEMREELTEDIAAFLSKPNN